MFKNKNWKDHVAISLKVSLPSGDVRQAGLTWHLQDAFSCKPRDLARKSLNKGEPLLSCSRMQAPGFKDFASRSAIPRSLMTFHSHKVAPGGPTSELNNIQKGGAAFSPLHLFFFIWKESLSLSTLRPLSTALLPVPLCASDCHTFPEAPWGQQCLLTAFGRQLSHDTDLGVVREGSILCKIKPPATLSTHGVRWAAVRLLVLRLTAAYSLAHWQP